MSNITLYQPTAMQPSNTCVDLNSGGNFTCQVNGSQADSYELTIKDPSNNNVLYDSGNATNIPNSNGSIVYSGSWTTNSNQIFDDTNSTIQYFGYGWRAYSDNTGTFYNNTSHQSYTANDYLQMNFVGTGINCYFTEGKDKGVFQVYVDGVDKGTVDTYISTGTGSNGNNFRVNAYSITDLPLASHTIKILVTGNKNGASTNDLIEFDYFQVLNSNGSKNSNTSGNYLQYQFSDTGISVYADNTPDSGIVDIYIDNVKQTTVDLYSSDYNLNQSIYTNYNLSSGIHTLKIIVTGNKNTQSKDSYFHFDSLMILNKTTLPTNLYDGDTLSITIPANTITQRGALKWQLTYWNSSNNGEYVTSVEKLFFNMSVPTVTTNLTDIVTNKSIELDGTYSQAENVRLKKWNATLYAVNYVVNEGYFNQNNGITNGEIIDEGSFDDIGNATIRYNIDEGHF